MGEGFALRVSYAVPDHPEPDYDAKFKSQQGLPSCGRQPLN